MLLSASMVIAMLADATAVKPAKDKNDPDKLICRRQVMTGSLVKSTRRCLTRAQWSRLSDQGRRDAENITQRTGSNASN
jgi:hypothetical protein